MFSSFVTESPQETARRLEASPLPQSLYDLLAETAENKGDCPAWSFIDSGVTRTWSQVLAKVDRAAAAFSALGIAPGTHVAIMTWNCEEFPVTWLALARLQAVMIPVNATYTSREVEYALKTSDARFVILEEEFLYHMEHLEEVSVPDERLIVIGVEAGRTGRGRSWGEVMEVGERHGVPDVPRRRDALLNLQYTSGTTGFSKACMLTHEYWLVLALGSSAIFSTELRRFYVGSSLYYMVGQRILLNAMVSGGCAFIPRRPGAKRFMADVRRLNCDYCALFEMVYKQPPRPEDADNRLKIATIFAFAPENHRDFQERFDVYGQEFYGMTEIGGGTYMPVGDLHRMTGSGSCGVAAPFRELMIADPQGRPVGDGEAGELWVRGRGILTGYYKNPEATEAAFHGDWFRTGDIARRDGEGFYYILGRTKDMVRRSGENISAREIESVLRTMAEIQDAAIVPVPDDYREEEVKAYIQLSPGLSPEDVPPERILAHCADHLAAFKIPRYLEYRDSFPLTDSQRVQKRVLIAEKADLRAGSYDRQEQAWL